MKSGWNVFAGVALAALLVSAGACGKSEKEQTVGEKVGGALDKAVEQTGQAMEKAGDAVKQAGESMKEAGEKMKEEKK